MSTESNRITCQICGAQVHVIATHLTKDHPDVTVDRYRDQFPLAATMSADAIALVRKRQLEAQASQPANAASVENPSTSVVSELFLHDVFGFGKAPAAMSATNSPIKIKVFEAGADVPDKDPGYIFDINMTKTVVMALEMNLPLYLWGHAGVGKSTILEQVCAFTGRNWQRVQHTANTEEADIEGHWKAENGETKFVLGPLATAMQNGDVYCADEYDFGNPQVIALYQAVLEGKPLRIKSANMIIRPHENFRFVATGNTNGAGDESGLYAGTQIQNAANYERFAIVSKVEYMPRTQEMAILKTRFGIDNESAKSLVEFAAQMRGAFERREVAIPMSPRSLQFAARLGVSRKDYAWGIQHAYINRLPDTSAEFARSIMQRHFA